MMKATGSIPRALACFWIPFYCPLSSKLLITVKLGYSAARMELAILPYNALGKVGTSLTIAPIFRVECGNQRYFAEHIARVTEYIYISTSRSSSSTSSSSSSSSRNSNSNGMM